MGRPWMILAVFLIHLQTGAGFSLAESDSIPNPHQREGTCGSCHKGNPSSAEVDKEEYHLLKDSIDETCQICHPYDCCRIYALKGHNHPSDVGKWDVKKFSPPRKLPLFGGKITCTTCHLSHLPEKGEPPYGLLRMVTLESGRVDWDDLCVDCHKDY